MSNRIKFSYDLWIDNQQGYKVVTLDGDEVIDLHSLSEFNMLYGPVRIHNNENIVVLQWDLNGKHQYGKFNLFLVPVVRAMSEMGG